MANAEMHAIKVQHTPMLWQRTLSPGVKLLGERLVETTVERGGRRSRPNWAMNV